MHTLWEIDMVVLEKVRNGDEREARRLGSTVVLQKLPCSKEPVLCGAMVCHESSIATVETSDCRLAHLSQLPSSKFLLASPYILQQQDISFLAGPGFFRLVAMPEGSQYDVST